MAASGTQVWCQCPWCDDCLPYVIKYGMGRCSNPSARDRKHGDRLCVGCASCCEKTIKALETWPQTPSDQQIAIILHSRASTISRGVNVPPLHKLRRHLAGDDDEANPTATACGAPKAKACGAPIAKASPTTVGSFSAPIDNNHALTNITKADLAEIKADLTVMNTLITTEIKAGLAEIKADMADVKKQFLVHEEKLDDIKARAIKLDDHVIRIKPKPPLPPGLPLASSTAVEEPGERSVFQPM
jgi:hypothetical protein